MTLTLIQNIPESIRVAFEQKVVAIAQRLSVKYGVEFDPDWLMVVMWKESRLNPQAVNKVSGATGLIQFMPATAIAFGTTTQYLYSLNHLQQLDWVEKYYSQSFLAKKKPSNLYDAYFAVFYPDLIGRPDSYTLSRVGQRIYIQNRGLDIDKDGDIQVSDIKGWLIRSLPGGIIVEKKSHPQC